MANAGLDASQESRSCNEALNLIGLRRLIDLTSGDPSIAIGLVDGPVALDHPDLGAANIRKLSKGTAGYCSDTASIACEHGTFIAGMLCAKRGCLAPAICPDCTLLVRPIFSESRSTDELMPGASAAELAQGILDVAGGGARIINLSLALAENSPRGEAELTHALDYAARNGIIVVAAAGNQGALGSSVITRHPWVIPVAAYGSDGRLLPISNLGGSIGRRGIGAPAERITSLRAGSGYVTLDGTSVAAPFVTGTIALLWSCFPAADATDIKLAINAAPLRRKAIVPTLLDAEGAYRTLAAQRHRQ